LADCLLDGIRIVQEIRDKMLEEQESGVAN
jgi:hypothetical protein